MILLCNDFVCTQMDHGEMTDQNAHNLNVFEHHLHPYVIYLLQENYLV